MSASGLVLCGPPTDCADPHTLRWYCMRGHDGAAPGVCPLVKCDRQGANRHVEATTSPDHNAQDGPS